MNLTLDSNVVKTVERALREGARLHAFLSGGGLRVLRLEMGRRGKLMGYGEHPYVSEAFRILADDYNAGGRPYGEVYGEGKVENCYLTGSSTPNDDLDAFVRKGSTFDAFVENEEFVFELHGYMDQKWPEDVCDRAKTGERFTWTSPRGVVFQCEKFVFPGNGEVGCSFSVVTLPPGMKHCRATFWEVVQRGRGKTLFEAILAAFAAEHEEKIDSEKT